MPPGFDKAAEALMQAVNDAGGRNLDFAKAAAALGVTEDVLRAALPPPPNSRPFRKQPADCQSARNLDPLSASKIDPPCGVEIRA
jgi:hypothetical protein